MKYIKRYEKLNLEIGDYVVMNALYDDLHVASYNQRKEFIFFIKYNIGNVIDIYDYTIEVKYYNIPTNIKNLFIDNAFHFSTSRIKYQSKTKKGIEIELEAEKYNL